MIKTECDRCGEFMWIEETADTQLSWTSGVEWNRLQALIDMGFRYVWECFGCGHFEPIYGRVRPVAGGL